MHIDGESEDMKGLWVWYGLTMMSTVMRRSWKWNSVVNRKNSMFHECVMIGDEALMLQIIELRIDEF